MSDSITLIVGEGESLSVAIDYKHQIRDFLAARLPSEDVLFARWTRHDIPNPLACNNAPEFLTPPYPELPSIAVGELQWPTGASRYARALYVVDWITMRKVAQAAWGWEPEVDEEEVEITPTDVPDVWGTAHYPISVRINSESEGVFRCSMYALPPYRVTGQGIDLWLLPLVDQRFLGRDKVSESTDTKPEGWFSFLSDAGTKVAGAIAIDSVDYAYGDVDPRLYRTVQPQRTAQVLDIGALSVGRRVVVDPGDGLMRALSPANSTLRRNQRIAAKAFGELLSGGTRGVGALPEAADLYCQRSGAIVKKSAFISGGNVGYVRLPVWTSWEYATDKETETTAFAAQVVSDIAAWSNSGGQYCYVGAFDYLPSGFDDYLSIQILETEPEKYVFRSRIYELPNVFLPPVVLAGGKDSSCGGGGGDSILFDIVDVECTEEDGICVYVQWTHYSGSCTEEPPGIDAYTGLIKVYDRCVFAYYTTDFLLNGGEYGGAQGRATYWFEDGNCEGKWIVDSICGTPECS